MTGSSFTMKGGADLLQFLDDLPKKWVDKVVRGGSRAAAGVIRDEARGRVKKKSGLTAKAIKVSSPRRDGDIVSVKVQLKRAKGTHGYVGVFLEYGIAPHAIAPKKKARAGGDAKQALSLGPDFVRAAVQHPGFGEMPFMRPALDAKGEEAVNAFGQYVRSRLTWGQLQAPLVSSDDLKGDEE